MAKCPKCEGEELIVLQSSGRQLCRSCGWSSNQPINETEDTRVSTSQPEPSAPLESKPFVSLESEPTIPSKPEQSVSTENFSPPSNPFTNEPGDNEPNNSKYLPTVNDNRMGILLFIIGIITMLGGLGMDTTVCSSNGKYSIFESCTHNIGKLNSRSNVVNTGGFIAVCGAVLTINTRKYKDT